MITSFHHFVSSIILSSSRSQTLAVTIVAQIASLSINVAKRERGLTRSQIPAGGAPAARVPLAVPGFHESLANKGNRKFKPPKVVQKWFPRERQIRPLAVRSVAADWKRRLARPKKKNNFD